MELIHFISFVALFAVASAQWPLQCPPKPPTVTPFDPERYLGDWYVQRNIYGTVCERVQSRDAGNGNISEWHTLTAGEAGSQVEGGCAWVEVNPDCDCGDLTLHIPGVPGVPYLILDTDYETFISVYTCAPFGIEIPWVFTRETNPTEETIEKGLDAFRRNGLLEPTVKGEHLPECEYGYTPNCLDDNPPPKYS